MQESVFMDGVRALFAMLDRMVYSLITVFYNTISDLASAQLVKSSVINDISGRIYALLGIFMLFKLSFSLINYIIDPDQIADKTKGGGALIKNIVITFALIVSTPFCFDLLYEAQSALLADQVLPRFILGIDIKKTGSDKGGYKLQMTDCENELVIPNMGNYLGLAIFKPFFVPEKQNAGAFANNGHDNYCNAGEIYGESSVKHLLQDSDVYNSPKGWSTTQNYAIDYSFFLSTAIGVVVALILLGYCFDIATRSIKLLFLEVIAPIPVISYIDPNSSKSGMFIKWLKEVGGTWISLFTRLASFYLAVFIIQQITATDGALYFVTGYNFEGSVAWIKILIIIGALIFAKQLPKILENILGFQLGGNMTLNPFKKLGNEALGFNEARKVTVGAAGIATGAALGAVGGAAANAWAIGVNNKKAKATLGLTGKKRSEWTKEEKANFKSEAGLGFFGGAGSILAGGFSAAARSGWNGRNGKFNPFKNADAGITASSLARSRRDAGFGIGSNIADKATDIAHIPQSYGTTDMLKNKKKAQEQQLNELMARTESLRDQSAYYKSQDPSKALAYNDAGKINWVEENGKQKREFAYKNYDEYLADFQNRLDTASGDDLERLNAIGILDREDFERARAFDKEIVDNDNQIASIKKEISKIEENMKKKK